MVVSVAVPPAGAVLVAPVPTTGPVPREVVPLKNVTVPEGAIPAEFVVIVEVNVTLVEVVTPLEGDGCNPLDVLAWVIVKTTAAEVLGLKLASPL